MLHPVPVLGRTPGRRPRGRQRQGSRVYQPHEPAGVEET